MTNGAIVNTYREIFSQELERNGWDQLLYGRKVDNRHDRAPNAIVIEAQPKIKIFDISSDGAMKIWTIDVPPVGPNYRTGLLDGERCLSQIPMDLATRFIAIGAVYQDFSRDLIGVHYSIPPAFFRALAFYTALRPADGREDPGTSHWPKYDIQLPEYIIEAEELFLDLGKGCLGFIKPLDHPLNSRKVNHGEYWNLATF